MFFKSVELTLSIKLPSISPTLRVLKAASGYSCRMSQNGLESVYWMLSLIGLLPLSIIMYSNFIYDKIISNIHKSKVKSIKKAELFDLTVHFWIFVIVFGINVSSPSKNEFQVDLGKYTISNDLITEERMSLYQVSRIFTYLASHGLAISPQSTIPTIYFFGFIDSADFPLLSCFTEMETKEFF